MTGVVQATPKHRRTSYMYLHVVKVTFSLEYFLFKCQTPHFLRGNFLMWYLYQLCTQPSSHLGITFLWNSSHVTNWSTNKLVKLAGSNYFGNLPSFVLIIFFSTRSFCASSTVIRLICNNNCRHHKNITVEIGAFLSNPPPFFSSYFQLKVLI